MVSYPKRFVDQDLSSSVGNPAPRPPAPPPDPPPTRVRDVVGGIVACMGLLTLVGVVAISVLSLPSLDKGPNIVAIASTALGVIGPIVGAYFGIRSASNAIDKVQESQ